MTRAIVYIESRDNHFEIVMYMGSRWIMSECNIDSPIKFGTMAEAKAAIKHMIDLNIWSGEEIEANMYRIEL